MFILLTFVDNIQRDSWVAPTLEMPTLFSQQTDSPGPDIFNPKPDGCVKVRSRAAGEARDLLATNRKLGAFSARTELLRINQSPRGAVGRDWSWGGGGGGDYEPLRSEENKKRATKNRRSPLLLKTAKNPNSQKNLNPDLKTEGNYLFLCNLILRRSANFFFFIYRVPIDLSNCTVLQPFSIESEARS